MAYHAGATEKKIGGFLCLEMILVESNWNDTHSQIMSTSMTSARMEY